MADEIKEPEYIREAILDNEEMRKIFVSGIPVGTEDEKLKAFFEGICEGNVSELAVIKKEGEKKSHFGFVTFETSELVDETLLKRESLNFNGNQLSVNRAVPKSIKTPGAQERTKKMFIANLPKASTEDEVRAYFEARHPKKYGTIETVQLIKKKNEQGEKTEESKGYGFVMVSSEDMADKLAIQHSTFTFNGRKIELKKSVPTNEGAGRGGGRGAKRGNFQPGGYGGGYGGGYDAYAGYAGGFGGYGAGFGGYGGYGGGYGAPQQRGGGRGRGARFQPY